MIFRLAGKSDDNQLRKLMRDTIVPGHIRMAYTREPDFFKAHRDIDDNTQIIVADDDGQIAGVGCRSIRKLLVNGKPSSVGYLSSLRLRPSAQNSTALARGYAYLKTLHADKQVPAYLTTIIQGNNKARAVLTNGRANLPAYLPMGNYLTHVCPVKRSAVLHRAGQAELSIQAATEVSPHELTAFLLEEGAKRQFFPVHNCNGSTSGILRSIGLENMLVARRRGRIEGTVAVWDQTKCKQHVIAGYSRSFRLLRPFLNLGLRIGNFCTLPASGKELRCSVAAVICIRDDNAAVFKVLLQHALDLAAEHGMHQLAVGMHERDPLVPVLKDFFHVVYRSWLYLVCWEDNADCGLRNNSLVPYLEPGTL
jgi:hypothetical protein